jgi:hypothetical protein
MNITIQKHSLRLDTAKYTLEDVKKEIEEDFQILISLGYTDLAQKKVKVEWGKALKQYGSCAKPYPNTYVIKINQNFIRVGDYKEVHNTIMHECIHCIDGCHNHGPNWKKAAAKVNARFDFTPIERCGTDDNYHEFLKSQAKYQITCKACHHTWNYYRKTRIFASCANGKATCSCGSKEFDCKTLK